MCPSRKSAQGFLTSLQLKAGIKKEAGASGIRLKEMPTLSPSANRLPTKTVRPPAPAERGGPGSICVLKGIFHTGSGRKAKCHLLCRELVFKLYRAPCTEGAATPAGSRSSLRGDLSAASMCPPCQVLSLVASHCWSHSDCRHPSLLHKHCSWHER